MHKKILNRNLFSKFSFNRISLIVFLVVFLFLLKTDVQAATITMPSTLSTDTTAYVLLSSSGTTPAIDGFSTDVVVTVSVATGSIKITTTAGLTAPTGYSSDDWTGGASEIAFEGSQTNINNALATLSYQGDSATSATLEMSASETGAIYNVNNGHYYVYAGITGLTWAQAKTAASETTYNGLTGYLVTITSEAENNFVREKVIKQSTINAFIGATDNELDGAWLWDTGPEAGTQFWSGDGSGSAIEDRYENWGNNEPGGGSGENYSEWSYNAQAWNDVGGTANGWTTYVIEYGGLDGETATIETTSTSITNKQNIPPTLSSSTPTDNATGIEVESNITLTFNEIVNAQSGNITIKKVSDDSTVEVFDVTSDISGSGSTVITINPSLDFDYETSYYILIDATAFDGDYSNSYLGITATSTLNFTTEDTPICPILDNAATYNAYPTCGVATCNEGYALTEGACIATFRGNSYVLPSSIGTGQVDQFIPMYESKPVGELKSEGINTLMYIGSIANFKAFVSETKQMQNFNFEIIDLDIITKKVKIKILPTQKILDINVENNKKVDLDNDGINDIVIAYNKLFINRIDLTIKQLEFKQEKVITKEGQVEEKKSIFLNGELLRKKMGSTVYLIEDNKKRAFFNEEAFLSNGYKWEDIKIVEDLSFILSGDMIYAQKNSYKSGDSNYYFYNDLKLGVKKEDVRELQKFLNNNGFILIKTGLGSPGNETDFFGKLTEQALIEFQKEKGIKPALGYFGPLTREFINSK